MTNSRAGKGLQLLDNHIASGTEATYTYTPSGGLNMETKYSYLEVQIAGKATAAFNLVLTLSGAADFDYSQKLADTTTLSTLLAAANANVPILLSTLLDGAVTFYATIKIFYNKPADLMYIHVSSSCPHEGHAEYHAETQITGSSVSDITIAVSTSTWIAGTTIRTYGLPI